MIWFLKKHYPQYCSIPHAINIILHEDTKKVLQMLTSDPETAALCRSAMTALENEAEGQIAGVIGSLQIAVARLYSSEICWVLSGDDFELTLNDPASPKLLVLGSEPGLSDALSAAISCIITVALKLMNKPGKLPSFILLDEAPTLYIPKLEMIPATARSNKIATIYMAQDYTQIVDSYGKEKADVILANLNNQFYGRVSATHSAKLFSEFFGRAEKPMESKSTSRSATISGHHQNESVSTSLQEKLVVKPQELTNLKVGEFIGSTFPLK